MASRKRASKTAAAATGKKLDFQAKEFQSALTQLNDAMEKLGKIQLCVECSCGPCNECSVCRICQVCRSCHTCSVCKICKVCNVCFECSCGPCASGG
jgi:hypothetical protein